MTVLTTNKRRIAIFIDGFSRATLIPFAPLLIGLLTDQYNDVDTSTNVDDTTDTDTDTDTNTDVNVDNGILFFPVFDTPLSMWPNVTFLTSLIIVAYLIGQTLGSIFGNHSKLLHSSTSSTSTSTTSTASNKTFSTIIGCILALQIFSYGLGYDHGILTLWFIRFVMGIFNGLIQSISTTNTNANTGITTGTNANANANASKYSIESNLAYLWIGGFGVSVLCSGFFYYPIYHSALNSFLTLQKQQLLQPSATTTATATLFDQDGHGQYEQHGLWMLFLKSSSSSSWSSWVVSISIFGCIVYVTQLVFEFCLRFIPDDKIDKENDCHYDDDDDRTFGDRNQNSTSSRSGSGSNSIINTTPSALKRRKGGNSNANINNNNSNNQTFSTQHFVNQEPLQLELKSPQSPQSQYNRPRLNSSHSHVSDVFFDCESFDFEFDNNHDNNVNSNVNVEMIDLEKNMPIQAPSEIISNTTNQQEEQQQQQEQQQLIKRKDNSNSIAKFENGKCIFDDGSPSHVPAGCTPSKIPISFQQFYKKQAKTKWEETIKWRKEQKLHNILARKHHLFSRVKEAYPHFIHGYSKMGYPVVYERPGKMKLKEMFNEGHDVDEMIYHYKFFLEYMSNVLCHERPELREALGNRPQEEINGDWGFVVVMDVAGISLSVLSGSVLQYLQKAGAVNNSHYPNTTRIGLLVNAPFWLSGAFSKIKIFLPKSTKADLIGASNVAEGLRKYIDDDQIPKEFGGSSPYALHEHPFEKELHTLVEQTLAREEEEEEEEEAEDEVEQKQEEQEEEVVIENKNDAPYRSNEWTYSSKNNDLYDLEAGNNLQMRPLNPPEPLSQTSVTFVDDTIGSPGSTQQNMAQYSEVECSFFSISIIYWLSCAIQGSLEVALPLWLLAPQKLGGRNYLPHGSGTMFFISSLVLIWLLRSGKIRGVLQISTQSPLRGYRIGTGSKAVLLVFLTFTRFLSFFDILLCPSIFIAMAIGRSSSAILHSIASVTYYDRLSISCDSRTRLGSTINIAANFVRNGGLTAMLGTTGEVFGALFVSPIMAWSLDEDHSYPFNAALSFYAGAVLCIVLYICSFSLKINGESYSRDLKGSRGSFIENIRTVALLDMQALRKATNWSLPPLRTQGKIIRSGHRFNGKRK